MDSTSSKFHHLLEANRILSSTLKLSDLLRRVMGLATEVVAAETSSLLLYDESTHELYFSLALGEQESQLKQIRLAIGEGIAGSAAREQKALIVNDAPRDTRWASNADNRTRFQTRSVLAVPLIYRGQLLGVLEAINKKNGDFTPEDAQLLEMFAAQAAVSLENARMFERLEEEKEKIQALFTQMSDGALFIDARGKKLFANHSAEKLLGSEHLAQGSLQDILAGFEATPPVNALLSGNDACTVFSFSRQGDKPLFLEGVASRIFRIEGGVLGFLFVFRDATEERKESMVKKNFLSLMSHKLKTPLVAITGYGPLLLEDDTLSDFHKKAIASIHRQGMHLAGLVDKLLFFSMLESEHMGLAREQVGLGTIAADAITALKAYCEEKQATVTVDLGVARLPPLLVDRGKMEAALRNLIENAIKFNPHDNRRVEITGSCASGSVVLNVADNGPGIPPEERERVFQKFYQIEKDFTGQVEGTGLGLSLVKRIVEAHGGSVRLQSVVGQGSTFSIMLPEVLPDEATE